MWIKLATAKEDAFAKILAAPGNDVADVAALACSSLGWGLTANKVRLFMVAEAGAPKPALPAIDAALAAAAPLAEKATLGGAGVASGAWLVAAPIAPADGSGGAGACAPRAFFSKRSPALNAFAALFTRAQLWTLRVLLR